MTFKFSKATFEAICKSEEEAKQILDLMRNRPLSDIISMEPMQISGRTLLNIIVSLNKDFRAKRAKHAIDTRHEKPGGSRDKQRLIREIWATGKYTSRDLCAEQECAALNMSFSAARKALRNTPNRT